MEGPENIKAEIENNHLVLRIDLGQRLGRSKTGKTTIVGTTRGFMKVPVVDTLKGTATTYLVNVNVAV